jgi:hypothetical protein
VYRRDASSGGYHGDEDEEFVGCINRKKWRVRIEHDVMTKIGSIWDVALGLHPKLVEPCNWSWIIIVKEHSEHERTSVRRQRLLYVDEVD